MTYSPVLANRIDALSGCQGHWLLIRNGEPDTDCSHYWHESPDEHLAACLADHWRTLSLGFVPSNLGFSDYSSTGLVGLANYRDFLGEFAGDAVHELGYGWNGRGVCVDVRFLTDEMSETIQALESYPLISDDTHSQIECEVIEKDWSSESISDRVRMLQECGLCVFAARDDFAPFRLPSLFEMLIESADSYPTAYA